MNKLFKALEIFWLVAALGSACIAVYFLIMGNRQDALYFSFVFLIGSIMYLLRRYQRKNQDKISQANQMPPKK
jgi:lipid-A-disaccharide synthase-like uncharacterized protein